MRYFLPIQMFFSHLPNVDIKTAMKTPLFSRSEQSVRNLVAPQATEVNPC